MSVNATELVSKLNFVMSVRKLREDRYIESYPNLPESSMDEEEIVKDLVFTFLKKRFPGCRIRQNQNSYSLRLDSHIHRKANKLRAIYNGEPEWKQWFEQNHNQIYRKMRDYRQSFPSGYALRREERNGNIFLYVPFKPNRIYSYLNTGMLDLMRWIDNEYKKDERLAEVYDEAIQLMEQEIERKERERRERIARELRDYKAGLARRLYQPIAELQESDDATERLFAYKMQDWARQNGKAPETALVPTALNMIPTGLKVKVMSPPGSEEEGWIALPPFDGYQEPEGYEMQGWGKVSSIDMTSERSRQGASPIVVQDYIYAEFHLEHWKHLLPDGYEELVEVCKQLHQQAETEIEPWLEQERIRKEQEEAERRAREEAERQAREEARRIREEQERQRLEELREQEEARAAAERVEAERVEAEVRAAEERRQALVAQLRQQVQVPEAQTPEEAVEAMRERIFESLQTTAEQTPEPTRATGTGVYRNSLAIPLERYVAIREDGTVRRFQMVESAVAFIGQEGVYEIRDYHAPFEIVETYNTNDDLPF